MKTILKTDGITKAGNEALAVGMKNIVTKDNVVPLAVVFTIGTIFIVHDLIAHGYGADIEAENKKLKVTFNPR